MSVKVENEDKIVALVKAVVDKYDPEQLLGIGAPNDEYEPEIKDIAHALSPSMNIDEVWIVVCNTFHWYFGDHSRPVLYWNAHRDIASAIMTGLQMAAAEHPDNDVRCNLGKPNCTIHHEEQK